MFVLHGQSYHEHSVVSLDTNDNGDRTMHCYTNHTDCCGVGSGSIRRGDWIFPNRSEVTKNGDGHGFYRNRSIGVVNLFWRMNAMIPTGMFCCKIPQLGQSGPSQKACIGVYPEHQGNAKVCGNYSTFMMMYAQVFLWWRTLCMIQAQIQ